MPEWNLEFFFSWILGSKAAQCPVCPSAISVASIASTSLLHRSTLPWLWECRGFPCTILNPGKDCSIILRTSAFLNSRPLSDWRRQVGGPRKEKQTLRLAATATAVFWVKGCRKQNRSISRSPITITNNHEFRFVAYIVLKVNQDR